MPNKKSSFTAVSWVVEDSFFGLDVRIDITMKWFYT